MSLDEDEYWESSVRAYYEAMAGHAAGGRATPDRGAFLPSPWEIEERKVIMHWLRGHGFNNHFVTSVMCHDTPNIDKVRVMVARYGPAETWRRCCQFLADTEYGKCDDYEKDGKKIQKNEGGG